MKIYVCGFTADKGQPGRCTPGDDHCNNYCNMAPQKGPMQDHPKEYEPTRIEVSLATAKEMLEVARTMVSNLEVLVSVLSVEENQHREQ